MIRLTLAGILAAGAALAQSQIYELPISGGGSGGVISAVQFHCVIVLPRQMVPAAGINDPDRKDYASIIWEDDEHRSSFIAPNSPTGCVIREPKP